MREVSRHSALGSHAPLEFSNPDKDAQEEAQVERRPGRPRRATLPSVIGPTPESLVDSGYHENRRSYLYEGQRINPSDIGFAVTSGSNPKRRSRSADAFVMTHESNRLTSVQWQDYRRRSDEIRYWRTSVGAMLVAKLDGAPESNTKPTGSTVERADDAVPVSVFEDDRDEEQETQEDKGGKSDQDNRGTFDFGILASTMQQEEDLPIEERMVTVEVKLMDLEYAISKIQANTPAPKTLIPDPPVLDQDPLPNNFLKEPVTRPTLGRQSPTSTHKSHLGSSSTTSGSVSTQPTAVSVAPPPSHTQSDDPFIDHKTRPTSDATTVRHQPVSPIPSERNYITTEPRNSTTSFTIDHFTALISLIRTEQSARHRLEAQVVELRREMDTLKQRQQENVRNPPPHQRSHSQSQYHQPNSYSPSAASFSRPRAWTMDRHKGSIRSRPELRRVPSCDTTSTDDGFQDVYETPTEQRRFEYEGGGAYEGAEGEAF